MAFAHRARIHGAGRVVGIDDHDGARLARDERGDFVRVRHELILGATGVVHGLAAVQRDRRRPQRIVGARNQHLVAGVEQRAQGEVDELADAVADEHFVGAHARDAARLLLHHHGFARREDALLVAVALRRRHVLDHREAHGLRRAEAEGSGIADVQRHDLVALALELLGATGETSADLVLDVAQAFAGADLGFLGHRRSIWKRSCVQDNASPRPSQPAAARNRPQFRSSRHRRQATWCEFPDVFRLWTCGRAMRHRRRAPRAECAPRGPIDRRGSFTAARPGVRVVRARVPGPAAARTLTTCGCTDAAVS